MAKVEPKARSDWNPMRDQFTDPKKNAYPNMDLHQQPGFKVRAINQSTLVFKAALAKLRPLGIAGPLL